MIRTETEYENAQKRLEQEKETLQRQRGELEEMDLSDEEVERALGPLISFRDQLREGIAMRRYCTGTTRTGGGIVSPTTV